LLLLLPALLTSALLRVLLLLAGLALVLLLLTGLPRALLLLAGLSRILLLAGLALAALLLLLLLAGFLLRAAALLLLLGLALLALLLRHYDLHSGWDCPLYVGGKGFNVPCPKRFPVQWTGGVTGFNTRRAASQISFKVKGLTMTSSISASRLWARSRSAA
jgi:hypothetical protein